MSALPRPLRGALLDLDGTLVDTEHCHLASADAVLRALGHTLPDDDWRPLAGAADPEFWEALRPRLQLTASVPALIAARTAALCRLLADQTLTPAAGVLELLDVLRCHAIPAIVASSSPRAQIAAILAAAGLAEQLPRRLSALDDVPRFKPAPDVYLAAAAELGVPPVACLALEDSARGVAAARAAGCFVVWTPSPTLAVAPPPGADLYLRSIRDLVPLIRDAFAR